MLSDIRFYRVLPVLGALVAIGALGFACAPFSESLDDAPPVDRRRSDDPTVPFGAPLDSGIAPGDAGVVSNGDSAPPVQAGPGCKRAADCERVVFVTSQALPGGAIGGITHADAICNALASASTHPRVAGRTFKAWLSDTTSSPSMTFVRGTKAYVRPDGARIATDYADLTSGNTLESPIELDELGRTQNGTVWSATSPSGRHDGADCSDWQDPWSSYGGAQGEITATAGRWTSIAVSGLGAQSNLQSSDCRDVDSRFYCFEE